MADGGGTVVVELQVDASGAESGTAKFVSAVDRAEAAQKRRMATDEQAQAGLAAILAAKPDRTAPAAVPTVANDNTVERNERDDRPQRAA
jgi:hypothetical protein